LLAFGGPFLPFGGLGQQRVAKRRIFCLKNENDITQDNPVPIRMAPRQEPGVYMVLCLANNKRYYGQSKNISVRISQHKTRLRKNIHEVSEMQHDFNLYGESMFEFSCLFVDKNNSEEQRKALETERIGRFFSICYNKSDKMDHKKENNPFWGKTHTEETRRQISKSQSENRQLSNFRGFSNIIRRYYLS